MLKDYYYKVAGFTFVTSLPEDKDIHCLLPSFVPFCQDTTNGQCDGEEMLFCLTVSDMPVPMPEDARILEEAENDMGHVRLSEVENGYMVELNNREDTPVHVLRANRTFTAVRACLHWNDPYAGDALCALLRITYSLAILPHGGISIHAAAVVLNGRAYLFMGKSGTGKSTHAALWQRCFAGCELLNDDNPTVREENGQITVYGTPWSGKTPCYRNLDYPLGGVVRLRQAGENRFEVRMDDEAFVLLLPGCSAIRSDRTMCENLYDTLAQMVSTVKTGELECLPDEEAALLCAASLGAYGDDTAQAYDPTN